MKKGTVKLFPFKDFDFIGKHVVCQKCCQKFASIMSYRVHIGTSICIRTYNGPNLVYLKYKNRNCRRIRKKNKNKLVDDLHHDIKKNLLNPEMLNTLQTRNNCYSDAVYQRKIKEKQAMLNQSYDPSVKKPRGRPRKNENMAIEVQPKKRGRPKKIHRVSIGSPSQENNNLSNILQSNETESKESETASSPCNVDDAFNNNVLFADKLKLLSSKMKTLTETFWKLISFEWKNKKETTEYKNPTNNFDQGHHNNENQTDLTIFHNIELLKTDLKLISEQCRLYNESSYNDELELMLSKLNEKHDEFKLGKHKKTDTNNGFAANKGKENIQRTFKNNSDEIETDSADTEINSDSDLNVMDKFVKLWLEASQDTSLSSIEDSDSREFVDEKNATATASLEETSDNVALNFTSSVSNHLHYSYKPMLDCKICDKNFSSIAEWKMHRSEHVAIESKTFLCKICGLKFKVYKNYIKHVNLHGGAERNIIGDCKTYSKKLVCKKCGKQYNYLKSYFAHVKTHMK